MKERMKIHKIQDPNIGRSARPEPIENKFYMSGSPAANHENCPGLSSPLMGEDQGGGGYGMAPLTLALSHQGRGE
jgi:hypothetical protein